MQRQPGGKKQDPRETRVNTCCVIQVASTSDEAIKLQAGTPVSTVEEREFEDQARRTTKEVETKRIS